MDAVIAVTAQGAALAQKIKEYYPHIVVYEKRGRESGKPCCYYDSMMALMKDIFLQYDRIACIMATGIVVRSIAPLLLHKTKDPAIVVLDEKGQHVISLLSGHLGGANQWTQELAAYLGSDPVITTATDVNQRPAADMVAKALGLYIDSMPSLRKINGDIVAGLPVKWYIDASLEAKEAYKDAARAMGVVLEEWQAQEKLQGPCVIVTDRLIQEEVSVMALRPPTMIVGIGCRRGASLSYIEEAIQQAVTEVGRSFHSIAALASVVVKKDEPGLWAFAKKYNKDLVFYEIEELAAVTQELGLEESAFVKKTIGTGNVCEAAAIKKGGLPILWQKKQKHTQVTTAISPAKLPLSELGLGMKKN